MPADADQLPGASDALPGGRHTVSAHSNDVRDTPDRLPGRCNAMPALVYALPGGGGLLSSNDTADDGGGERGADPHPRADSDCVGGAAENHCGRGCGQVRLRGGKLVSSK